MLIYSLVKKSFPAPPPKKDLELSTRRDDNGWHLLSACYEMGTILTVFSCIISFNFHNQQV